MVWQNLQRGNKVKVKYVLWDIWFSAAENFDFVHYDLKKQFIAALKSNRLTALIEEDRRQVNFNESMHWIYKRLMQYQLVKRNK